MFYNFQYFIRCTSYTTSLSDEHLSGSLEGKVTFLGDFTAKHVTTAAVASARSKNASEELGVLRPRDVLMRSCDCA